MIANECASLYDKRIILLVNFFFFKLFLLFNESYKYEAFPLQVQIFTKFLLY